MVMAVAEGKSSSEMIAVTVIMAAVLVAMVIYGHTGCVDKMLVSW